MFFHAIGFKGCTITHLVSLVTLVGCTTVGITHFMATFMGNDHHDHQIGGCGCGGYFPTDPDASILQHPAATFGVQMSSWNPVARHDALVTEVSRDVEPALPQSRHMDGFCDHDLGLKDN